MKHTILPFAAAAALLALSPEFAAATPSSEAAPAAASLQGTVTDLAQDDNKDRAALGEYNLDKSGLAIDGYDPVAYFPGHGDKAVKGSKTITTKYRGVTYRFSSEANKKTFLADPSKYEPMYGGWCAWAISDGKGSKTDPSPKSFTIEDGRLYLFYDGFLADTRKSWKKKGGATQLKATADKNWTRISQEAAR